jgi:hypothetical protein
MAYDGKIDALELVINILREHEKKLDELVSRAGILVEEFEALIEEKAREYAREMIGNALEKFKK